MGKASAAKTAQKAASRKPASAHLEIRSGQAKANPSIGCRFYCHPERSRGICSYGPPLSGTIHASERGFSLSDACCSCRVGEGNCHERPIITVCCDPDHNPANFLQLKL